MGFFILYLTNWVIWIYASILATTMIIAELSSAWLPIVMETARTPVWARRYLSWLAILYFASASWSIWFFWIVTISFVFGIRSRSNKENISALIYQISFGIFSSWILRSSPSWISWRITWKLAITIDWKSRFIIKSRNTMFTFNVSAVVAKLYLERHRHNSVRFGLWFYYRIRMPRW